MDENPERLIERHARAQQVGELLGKKVEMTVAERLHRARGGNGRAVGRFRCRLPTPRSLLPRPH